MLLQMSCQLRIHSIFLVDTFLPKQPTSSICTVNSASYANVKHYLVHKNTHSCSVTPVQGKHVEECYVCV